MSSVDSAKASKHTVKEEQISRMKELIYVLNEASRAYYQEDRELMSNLEYDKLYDELQELERVTEVLLSSSPTVNIGYEALDELPKEAHGSTMLSLDKTKEPEALKEWLKDIKGLLSWKLDGLTIVLTYEEGALSKAVTRGNGEIGEVITNNARVFKNIPMNISYQGRLVLRGEAVISYSDFEKINEEIEDIDAKYKNPRNLCSGSVRQLNNEVTAKRNVNFFAFSLVSADEADFKNSRDAQLMFLRQLGFSVVDYRMVDSENIIEEIEQFENEIHAYDLPSDGLVLTLDDIAYGQALGKTSKFPKDSIAFKWADEIKETVLSEIEWSPSRTGLINPVAVFEPVELEGSTVSRASVHNISIMRALELGVGDTIQVYKANMIIPQIAENLTRSGVNNIPKTCPECGGKTELRRVSDAEVLCCNNPECKAKLIKGFTLFVSRDAMNIEGLSEATLEKFIRRGFLNTFVDIFHLERFKDEIIVMEGFGEKSYENIILSTEKARDTTMPRLIYGLGILNIGSANAKMICRVFHNDIEKLKNATFEELSAIDGVGEIIANVWTEYFENSEKREQLDSLYAELKIESHDLDASEMVLLGKTFVITGSVEQFENRNELKEFIESKGGKATGSVTAKTDYLINNDTMSSSSKNKKAKELNVPIISEEEFLRLI